MTELGNGSLKKCGVVFTVFLLKAWLPECCFQAGALLPVRVVTASLMLWQSGRGRWDNFHSVCHSLGLGLKYKNSCPSLLSEQRTFIWSNVDALSRPCGCAEQRPGHETACPCLARESGLWFWVLGTQKTKGDVPGPCFFLWVWLISRWGRDGPRACKLEF